MTAQAIEKLLAKGEGLEVEFKECFFELSKTCFQTICAFLNRQGGHLLLGVKDNGTVEGVLESEAEKMVNEIVTNGNSLPKLSPPFYLSPQIINYKGKIIIYVYVPESSQVHNTAGRIFDRNATDGDIDITSIQHQVTQLYIRKQQIYSENQIYPAVRITDFRKDLLQRVRTMAANQRAAHPWMNMNDEQLLQSAGLYQKNYATGEEGYTMAAVLLLGNDGVIQSILPHYKTDAILRVENVDRYDDRDDVRTNLIESYDRLMVFIAKHLPDKFYQEGTQRISLRDRIFREIVANLLVHREFTNAFPAKLVIEEWGVITENWNRPHGSGLINPALFSPFPKNPVIAKFFKEIGWVEELGSGVRNTFKYVSAYSDGKNPVFEEGDVFRCRIPLDRLLSFFIDTESNQHGNQDGNQDEKDLSYRFRGNIWTKEGFTQWISILHELFEPLIQSQYFDLYRDMLEEFPVEWKKLLEFCRQPRTRKEILEDALKISNQTKNFRTNVSLLLEHGLLTRTQPDKPQSKNQKYIITHDGEKLLRLLNDL